MAGEYNYLIELVNTHHTAVSKHHGSALQIEVALVVHVSISDSALIYIYHTHIHTYIYTPFELFSLCIK
jgi:hypothetical protein